jgi:hypothetical protein
MVSPVRDDALADQALAEQVRRLGTSLTKRSDDIGREITAVIRDALPEVWEADPALPTLLQQVVDSNVENLMTSLSHRVAPKQAKATTAALLQARLLAEHDVPSYLMVRAYQLGHQRLMRRLLDELAASNPRQKQTIEALADLLDYTLSFNDAMCQAAVHAHQVARDAWSHARGAVTARRLADILDGTVADPEVASRMLSYDVHGWHLGLVIWRPPDNTAAVDLDAIARQIRTWPNVQGTLILPDDEAAAFGWIRVPSATPDLSPLDALLADTDRSVQVACGNPGNGLDGFRETHQQAQAARRVAELPDVAGHRVLHFGQVAPISFLATRPHETTTWVHGVLGGLAADGDEVARLRDTLRVFLEVGESNSEAATRLFVHRNTVKYRVARACDLLPVRLEDNRLDIALALGYCHWVPTSLR